MQSRYATRTGNLPLAITFKTFWTRQSVVNGSFMKWYRDQRIPNNSIGGWAFYWSSHHFFSTGVCNHSSSTLASLIPSTITRFYYIELTNSKDVDIWIRNKNP